MTVAISEDQLDILTHRQKVIFSFFCAKQLRSLWQLDDNCLKLEQVIEKWLKQQISPEECFNSVNAISYLSKTIYAIYVESEASKYALQTAELAIDSAKLASLNSEKLQQEQLAFYNLLAYFKS